MKPFTKPFTVKVSVDEMPYGGLVIRDKIGNSAYLQREDDITGFFDSMSKAVARRVKREIKGGWPASVFIHDEYAAALFGEDY